MSTHISYRGKHLGRFKPCPFTYKLEFIAEDFDCLKNLFSLKHGDIVEVEGTNPMPYDKFKEKWLDEVNAYYPNMDSWMYKAYKGKTAEEVGRELDSRGGA